MNLKWIRAEIGKKMGGPGQSFVFDFGLGRAELGPKFQFLFWAGPNFFLYFGPVQAVPGHEKSGPCLVRRLIVQF